MGRLVQSRSGLVIRPFLCPVGAKRGRGSYVSVRLEKKRHRLSDEFFKKFIHVSAKRWPETIVASAESCRKGVSDIETTAGQCQHGVCCTWTCSD